MSRESVKEPIRLASLIDHTLLKPTATEAEVLKIAEETQKFGFASACIPPCFTSTVSKHYPDITIATVISFPFGFESTSIKLESCKTAILSGAAELDIVTNISLIKSQKWDFILEEMKMINDYVHENDKIIKWIFETSALTEEEIINLCNLCNDSGADFAKTSTGFGTSGANISEVKLMKAHLNKSIQIKASGGIRNYEQAMEFINCGVTRIGTSSGIKIIS